MDRAGLEVDDVGVRSALQLLDASLGHCDAVDTPASSAQPTHCAHTFDAEQAGSAEPRAAPLFESLAATLVQVLVASERRSVALAAVECLHRLAGRYPEPFVSAAAQPDGEPAPAKVDGGRDVPGLGDSQGETGGLSQQSNVNTALAADRQATQPQQTAQIYAPVARLAPPLQALSRHGDGVRALVRLAAAVGEEQATLFALENLATAEAAERRQWRRQRARGEEPQHHADGSHLSQNASLWDVLVRVARELTSFPVPGVITQCNFCLLQISTGPPESDRCGHRLHACKHGAMSGASDARQGSEEPLGPPQRAHAAWTHRSFAFSSSRAFYEEARHPCRFSVGLRSVCVTACVRVAHLGLECPLLRLCSYSQSVLAGKERHG